MAWFKTRRKILATGGARFGDDATNHSDLDVNGRMTMAGAARVYKDLWIPATAFHAVEPDMFAGANGATTATTGSPVTARPIAIAFGNTGSNPVIPVLSASLGTGLDARATTMFFAPTDAATTGSVVPYIVYTTKVAMATAGSAQVFKINYAYLGTSGSATPATSGSIHFAASMATIGLGKIESASIGTMPSFNAAASPMVFLQLVLESSNASSYSQGSGSAEESILGIRFRYLADNLGLQVS